MNRHILKLILPTLLFFLNGCTAQQKLASSQTSLDNALLWQLSHPDWTKPSYLFGTIHIINAEDYFLPDGFLTALDAADKIVFEIDIADMSDMSVIMGIIPKIMMDNGTTLKDLLSEGDYALITSHFEKMGLPSFMLERIKPMFLSVMASGDINPMGMVSGKVKSYEMEIFQLASSSGKPTGGLETMEYQLDLFDEIPYEAQAKMLVESVKSSKSEDDTFKIMVDMYKAQDINAMAQSIKDEAEGLAQYEDKLLTQRNKNWIPLIMADSKEKTVLYAVGAGHLGGAQGVLNLLKDQGVLVTPLLK